MEYSILILIMVFAFVFLFLFLYFLKKYNATRKDFEKLNLEYEKFKQSYRSDLIEISTKIRDYINETIEKVIVPKSILRHLTGVISKGIVEKFAPFTKEFQEKYKLNPKDAIYLGEPIDYIVFDGWEEFKEEGKNVRKIVFVEVKTGEKSYLKPIQSQIKLLVQRKSIDWITLDLATGEKLATEEGIREILEKKDYDAGVKKTIDTEKIKELADDFILQKGKQKC